MFGPIPGGPNWIDKCERALACLNVWQEETKQAGEECKRQIQEWNATYLSDIIQNRPGMLHNYFECTFYVLLNEYNADWVMFRYPTKARKAHRHIPEDAWKRSLKPQCLIESLHSTNSAFAGIGQYLANNLCFWCHLYPGIPSYIICKDDKLFDSFQEAIIALMEMFIEKIFRKHCSLRANHLQLFQFNERANTNYMKGFIAIFKCTKVKVDAQLYNYHLRNGLLDRAHTMGESKWEPYLMEGGYRWLPVFFRGGNLNAWTIIWAMIPPLDNWGTGQEVKPGGHNFTAELMFKYS